MFQSPEIFLVVGVIILLFGGSQLPKLARSLGQAKKEFETGTHDSGDGDTPAKAETKTDAPKAETTEKTESAE